MKSYIENLSEAINQIEINLVEFMNGLSLKQYRDNPYSNVIVFVPTNYYSSETTLEQKQIQVKLKKDFSAWVSHIKLLFRNAPNQIETEIERQISKIEERIEIKNEWGISERHEENIKNIRDAFQVFP